MRPSQAWAEAAAASTPAIAARCRRDRARDADQPGGRGAVAVRDRGGQVALLRADTGDQETERRDEATEACQLGGSGGAHDQPHPPVGPGRRRPARDPLVQRTPRRPAGPAAFRHSGSSSAPRGRRPVRGRPGTARRRPRPGTARASRHRRPAGRRAMPRSVPRSSRCLRAWRRGPGSDRSAGPPTRRSSAAQPAEPKASKKATLTFTAAACSAAASSRPRAKRSIPDTSRGSSSGSASGCGIDPEAEGRPEPGDAGSQAIERIRGDRS